MIRELLCRAHIHGPRVSVRFMWGSWTECTWCLKKLKDR